MNPLPPDDPRVGRPPAGYPPYPPPGYPGPGGYPPPGYPPPGYGPSGYPPPGYSLPGYGPAGYPQAPPPAVQPGIIPLRPLTVSDIYNGAVGFIRANPRVTLGLTAVVVIITSIIGLIGQVFPLSVVNQLGTEPSVYQLSGRDLTVWGTSVAVGAVVTALGTIVLVGMLTVVVGRSIFGSPITAGQAWAVVRRRFPALIGLAVLLAMGAAALIGLAVFVIAVAIAIADAGGAIIIAMPLLLALAALAGYLYVVVSFAPTIVVLEQRPALAAIARSFTLVRKAFWRVLGILLLTGVISYLVATAVALPFTLIALGVGDAAEALTAVSPPNVLAEVGTTIGRIIVLPFTAGAVVLLYTDRRIRAEAFDLVLRSSLDGPAVQGGIPDAVWLIHPAN